MAKKLTLQDQWDLLKSQIEIISQQHLDEFLKDKEKPEFLYQVTRVGDVIKYNVTGYSIKCEIDGIRIYEPDICSGNKCTKKFIESVHEYIENIKKADVVVFVHYRRVGESSVINYANIVAERGYSFNPTDLESIVAHNKEMYAPREGFEPCQYCRKQMPIAQMVEKTIIGRGHKPVWNSRKSQYESKACVTHENLKFCSNDCAANEQMSREG